MRGVARITDVQFALDDDGDIECTVRSREDTFTFSVSRGKARAYSAELWRMLDEFERTASNVRQMPKGRPR